MAPDRETPQLIKECSVIDGKAPEGYLLSVEILASATQSEPSSVVADQWGVTVTDSGITQVPNYGGTAMKSFIKKTVLLLAAFALTLSFSANAFAEGTATYEEGAKIFIFAPGSSYSPTDLTYKATDTLTSGAENSCTEYAAKHNAARARENAGYVDGTQLAKIKDMMPSAANTSGCRGVYFDRFKGLWEALIIFQRKRHRLGYFKNYDDAAAARKKAENIVFGEFLEHCEEQKCN